MKVPVWWEGRKGKREVDGERERDGWMDGWMDG